MKINSKGGVTLWASLTIVGAILILGIGTGIKYYTSNREKSTLETKSTSEKSQSIVTKSIYKPGIVWREIKLPNGAIAFIKNHNLYIYNSFSGDVLLTENIPAFLGLSPANYKVTLGDWFGEDPVLLTSDSYGLIRISKEQDKFAFLYGRLQKDAITKDSGFYPRTTTAKILVYSLDGKLLNIYELDPKTFLLNYDLDSFDKELARFEGGTTKGSLTPLTYSFETGKLKELSITNITILSPVGGETFKAGDKITVRWKAPKNLENIEIAIQEICGDNEDVTTCKISKFYRSFGAPNTGEYDLKIPLNVPSGTHYHITVADTIGMGSQYGEQTKIPFKILASPTTVLPQITVLSPNGGEFYKVGDVVPIKWKLENISNFELLYPKVFIQIEGSYCFGPREKWGIACKSF